MKKIVYSLLAMFAFMSSATAQTGGFEGPGAPAVAPVTVEQALSMNDDAVVVLEGKIINSLGDEKYTFQDKTGEIIIEIDDEDWHGVKVTPDNTVEIRGEIDKDPGETTKIDVKSFSIK